MKRFGGRISALGAVLLGAGCASDPEPWSLACLESRPAEIRVALAPRDDVIDELRHAPRTNADRQERLRLLFELAGCDGERLNEQPVPGSRRSNLICTLEGSGSEVIVVGAHFDKVRASGGVADNWSGASMLPAVYSALHPRPRLHTFQFVGFAAEETGLRGSRHFVDQLDDDARGSIQAMVNLDTLALGSTKAEVHRVSPILLCNLRLAAAVMEEPLEFVNANRIGTSDFGSFRRVGLPVISIHSVSQATLSIMHSERDRFSEMDLDGYYSSYRVVAAFLALLDHGLAHRPPASIVTPPDPRSTSSFLSPDSCRSPDVSVGHGSVSSWSPGEAPVPDVASRRRWMVENSWYSAGVRPLESR